MARGPLDARVPRRRARSDPEAYDLRHSFASLLFAEGRQPLYVARQPGHSVAVLFSTYAHLIHEYAEAPNIDVDREIAKARRQVGVRLVSITAPVSCRRDWPAESKKEPLCGALLSIPLPGFEPGFPP